MKKIAILLVFLFLLPMGFAWKEGTHEAFATKICNDFNCGCLNQTLEGSIAPPNIFNDPQNYGNYDPASCKNSSSYVCPTQKNDIALKKTNEWLLNAQTDLQCNSWRDVGIASYYYLEGQDIWNQVYETTPCHDNFDTLVNDKIKNNETDWIVSACGEVTSSIDMTLYTQDFENTMAKYGFTYNNTKANTNTQVPKPVQNLVEKIVIIISVLFCIGVFLST